MPQRKIKPVNNEFYHIVKKGIDDREIFLDDEDHFRFINSLLVFNDAAAAPWSLRAFWKQRAPAALTRSNYKPKMPLLEIHTLCLMPNHFHLLVRQLTENGIALFMQKLGGYSWYFNKKYDRSGTLFQDRYKIVHIETDDQLRNTFSYIHTNPISLIEAGWKERGVKDANRAIEFLENDYLWSSYQDYLEIENFPSVITKNFFLEQLGGKEGVRKEIKSWILFKSSTTPTTRPGGVVEKTWLE